MGVPWGMIGTLGGEGTCAPSPRAAQAGQESSPAHPNWHMAHGSNDLPVPTLGLAAPPHARGHVPRGCIPVAALASGQHAHSRGRKVGSAPRPSKRGLAAACFLLLPRRLRKSFCLWCSSTSAVRTGKIPPCSQEHHRQVSQFFLLRQGKKKKKKTWNLQQSLGKHAG